MEKNALVVVHGSLLDWTSYVGFSRHNYTAK